MSTSAQLNKDFQLNELNFPTAVFFEMPCNDVKHPRTEQIFPLKEISDLYYRSKVWGQLQMSLFLKEN